MSQIPTPKKSEADYLQDMCKKHMQMMLNNGIVTRDEFHSATTTYKLESADAYDKFITSMIPVLPEFGLLGHFATLEGSKFYDEVFEFVQQLKDFTPPNTTFDNFWKIALENIEEEKWTKPNILCILKSIQQAVKVVVILRTPKKPE